MAANTVGLAWAKVHAALLTHTWRPHSSNLHHHWKVLGKYFNAHLISAGRVQRVRFFLTVITWVMVTVSMDVISSAANIQPSGFQYYHCYLSRATIVLSSHSQIVKHWFYWDQTYIPQDFHEIKPNFWHYWSSSLFHLFHYSLIAIQYIITAQCNWFSI